MNIYRTIGYTIVSVYGALAANRSQLRGEPTPVSRLLVRAPVSRRAVPLGQLGAQSPESESGPRLVVSDARHRSGAPNIRRRCVATPVY